MWVIFETKLNLYEHVHKIVYAHIFYYAQAYYASIILSIIGLWKYQA